MLHHRIAKKFGRNSSHRKALMSNLVTSLILHSSIKTTLPKAKQTRRDAEKLVTLARKGTLAARRIVAARLMDPAAVRKLFDTVVPALADYPNGGYTRILKLRTRRGDAAELCLLQWVVIPPEAIAPPPGEKEKEKGKKAAPKA